MDLTGSYTGNTRILSSSNNVRTEGCAKILGVTSTTVTVSLYGAVFQSMYPVYRLGFRFYTQRFSVTNCIGVTMTVSGWTSFSWTGSYNPNAGSIQVAGIGNGQNNAAANKFYTILYMMRYPSYTTWPYQWWDFSSSGTTYTFTFTFSSVQGDFSYKPNSLWISASMIWENSYWYYH